MQHYDLEEGDNQDDWGQVAQRIDDPPQHCGGDPDPLLHPRPLEVMDSGFHGNPPSRLWRSATSREFFTLTCCNSREWWARQVSNLQPTGYEPAALPLSYGPSISAYSAVAGVSRLTYVQPLAVFGVVGGQQAQFHQLLLGQPLHGFAPDGNGGDYGVLDQLVVV